MDGTTTASRWVKAKRCDSNACFEVAMFPLDGAVVLRAGGGLIAVSAEEWKAFIDGVQEGDFRSTYA